MLDWPRARHAARLKLENYSIRIGRNRVCKREGEKREGQGSAAKKIPDLRARGARLKRERLPLRGRKKGTSGGMELRPGWRRGGALSPDSP